MRFTHNLFAVIAFALAVTFSTCASAHHAVKQTTAQIASAASSMQATAANLSEAARNMSDSANKLSGQTATAVNAAASSVSAASAKVGDAASSASNTVTPILADALKSLVAALKSGADWASVQIPDVVKELIEWNIARDIGLLAIFPIFFLIFFFISKHYGKKSETWGDSNTCDLAQFFSVVFGVCALASAIGSIASFFINGFDLIQLIFAPKVWLLEYAASLFQSIQGK